MADPDDPIRRSLSSVFPYESEDAFLAFGAIGNRNLHGDASSVTLEPDYPRGLSFAQRRLTSSARQLEAYVYYARKNKRAFNRTYRQICNSLTIE